MVNNYKRYSVNDFDKFDCLKLSKRFYLVLLFVLRGYIVWILSVTNMQDRVVTLEFIYPEISLFFLSLISGGLGLFVVLIITLRRPEAPNWVVRVWPYSRTLLVSALIFDLLVNIIAFSYWQLTSMQWIALQTLISSGLITLCFTSQRMQINLQEFPQKLPE